MINFYNKTNVDYYLITFYELYIIVDTKKKTHDNTYNTYKYCKISIILMV